MNDKYKISYIRNFCILGMVLIAFQVLVACGDTRKSLALSDSPQANKSPTEKGLFSPGLGKNATMVSENDVMMLVFVPEGNFQMGWKDGVDDEKPQHSVYLNAFWIDQTEVTNAMYNKCVSEGICKDISSHPEKSNHPAESVDWVNAEVYCNWVGRRLPTEAEWEKAARGADGRLFPWGEGIDCNKANYEGCNGDTSPVGSYPTGASPYGALDMAGNVFEWVADWYDLKYYRYSPDRNPVGPDSGDDKV